MVKIFVLDRRTGEPVTKVEQCFALKRNETSNGEDYAETQSFSVGMPAIGTKSLSEKRMWGARQLITCCVESALNKLAMGDNFRNRFGSRQLI
ncbi:hypothetical protein W03_14560 [Nitrosomonas sp. PY1]|uniref:hypothetical protein n=1 Tax=Nitrosomonas sp. PY1 TaxID=1803906 RepID=UPI001FC7E820|nr:hypothetical protein [Nitrosomonas sp. PY1]GKS69452.1 hypothetical protein W03_14560 [Nitrosomonas sp. PY1]